MGCERIHKEKNMQRANFYFYFPKNGKGLGAEKCTSPEGEGLWVFIGSKTGRGCRWVVMAVSCKSGGFRLIMQMLQFVSLVSLGSGSGCCGLVCPVCMSFKTPARRLLLVVFSVLRLEAQRNNNSLCLTNLRKESYLKLVKRARKGLFLSFSSFI